MEWNKATIRTLLVRPTALDEPLQLWVTRVGGLEHVWVWLGSVRLSQEERCIFEALVNAECWQVTTERLGMSQATYYRHMHHLITKIYLSRNPASLTPPE